MTKITTVVMKLPHLVTLMRRKKELQQKQNYFVRIKYNSKQSVPYMPLPEIWDKIAAKLCELQYGDQI